MAEIVITGPGEKLVQLCESLITGNMTALSFCERVDAAVSDEFWDQVSEWEAENLLEDIQYEIEFYEPNPDVRTAELLDDDHFIAAVRGIYAGYREKIKNENLIGFAV